MLTLTSPTIFDGDPIPARHLGPGHGENISPALSWSGVPEGTRGWLLTLTDDDAPGYQHWLVALPPEATGLDEGTLPAGAVVGQGSRALGYEGPCPPAGAHHYVFTLAALGTEPQLRQGFGVAELEAAATGSVLATATLTATYRPPVSQGLRARAGRLARRLRRG